MRNSFLIATLTLSLLAGSVSLRAEDVTYGGDPADLVDFPSAPGLGSVAPSTPGGGNTVTIDYTDNGNNTITGDVIGGYGDRGSGDNTVNINRGTINGSINGGYGTVDHADSTNNTLNFNGYAGSVQNILNFQAINVDTASNVTVRESANVTLGANVNNDGTLAFLSDTAGTQINISSYSGNGRLGIETNLGAGTVDRIDIDALMANSSVNLWIHELGKIDSAIDPATGEVVLRISGLAPDDHSLVQISNPYYGAYTYQLFGENGEFKIGRAFDENNSRTYTQSETVVLNVVSQSSDPIFDVEEDVEFEVQEEWQMTKTGCSAKTNMTKFFLAVSKKRTPYLRVGLFLDSAVGEYRTMFVDDWSKPTNVLGTGDLNTVGGGLFFRWEKGCRARKNYLIGAVRGGNAWQDYYSPSLAGSSFDKEYPYYGVNLGVGVKLNRWRNIEANTYYHVLWTHLEGGSPLTDSLGQSIAFSNTDSFRSVTGVQFSKYYTPSLKLYTGVALDLECMGLTFATINGNQAAVSSLAGMTTVIDIGVQKWTKNNWRWDFGAIGQAGRRSGIGGIVGLNKRF